MNDNTTQKDLCTLATEMTQALQRQAQPQETIIEHPDLDRECKLILRYTGQGKTQLVTVIWARQPPCSLRAKLRDAFQIPLNVAANFNYMRSYGIMRLTWDSEPPQVEQLMMIEAVPGQAKAGMYGEEWA